MIRITLYGVNKRSIDIPDMRLVATTCGMYPCFVTLREAGVDPLVAQGVAQTPFNGRMELEYIEAA